MAYDMCKILTIVEYINIDEIVIVRMKFLFNDNLVSW